MLSKTFAWYGVLTTLLVLGLSSAKDASTIRGEDGVGRVVSFASLEEEALVNEERGGGLKVNKLSIDDDFPGLKGALKQQLDIGGVDTDEVDVMDDDADGGSPSSLDTSGSNTNAVDANVDDDEDFDSFDGVDDEGFEVMSPDEISSADEESKKTENNQFAPPVDAEASSGDNDDDAAADSSSSSSPASQAKEEYDLDVLDDEPVRGLPEAEGDDMSSSSSNMNDDVNDEDMDDEIDSSVRRVLSSHFPAGDDGSDGLADDGVADAVDDVEKSDLPTCSLTADGSERCRKSNPAEASSPPQLDLTDLLNLEEKEALEANAELFPPPPPKAKQRQLEEESDDPYVDPPPLSFGGKLCDTLETSPHVDNAAWHLEEDESPRAQVEDDTASTEEKENGGPDDISSRRMLKGHDMPLALLVARSPKTQMTGPILATLPLMTSSTSVDDTRAAGYKSCQTACVENLKCSAFSLVAILEDEGEAQGGRAKCQLYNSATGATPCPQGQCASGILCDRAE